MMVGTCCRISFLQYLPNELTKFGIKILVNSEAKTGYALAFQVYTGKVSLDKEAEGKGVSHRVVMELLSSYFGKSIGYL